MKLSFPVLGLVLAASLFPVAAFADQPASPVDARAKPAAPAAAKTKTPVKAVTNKAVTGKAVAKPGVTKVAKPAAKPIKGKS